VSPESLWVLCLLLFIDGATIAATSTVLLLKYGHYHEPWVVAVAGSAASSLGSAVQLRIIKWALSSQQPWMRRFTPSREKIEASLKRYPSASFLALTIARATPLPDAPLKIVAAVIGYPIRLYALATFLGSIPYFYVLALLGHHFEIPNWVLFALLGLVVAGIVVDRVRAMRQQRAAQGPEKTSAPS
jgi:uncharacterized membrane protein YdjX (TVP38/TMEM64 family)